MQQNQVFYTSYIGTLFVFFHFMHLDVFSAFLVAWQEVIPERILQCCKGVNDCGKNGKRKKKWLNNALKNYFNLLTYIYNF